ncbi:hypothetical protein CASFOL_035050 [Castilleja foliolosa]|uniref:Uncharacterized protein n=1 Tax=Castilleja foliolosa TaxID=1961234 RepID=A0ABD3BRQ8_9LAMI
MTTEERVFSDIEDSDADETEWLASAERNSGGTREASVGCDSRRATKISRFASRILMPMKQSGWPRRKETAAAPAKPRWAAIPGGLRKLADLQQTLSQIIESAVWRRFSTLKCVFTIVDRWRRWC